jgi:hypothetical protein
VSSAEGSGSSNPFAGYDVLSVHGIHDNQPDAVFHFVDEYVESVCIEEHQGGDDTWTEELTDSQSSVQDISGPTGSSMVGITSTELESFNELIKFDHMYFRQPPSEDVEVRSCEESIDHSETELFEVESKSKEEDGNAELSFEEDINLSFLSESDIAQLSNCLDWLIDSSSDALIETKAAAPKCQDTTSYMASLDTETCLQDDIDLLTPFTEDSFVSTNYFDCSIDKQNTYNSTIATDNLLKTNVQDSNSKPDRMPKGVTNSKKCSDNDLTFSDSLVNCSSPGSSSGCESDFSSTTYDDEHMSISTDVGFMDLSFEPFSDLFPALY